jgi:hypothetical protein
MFEHTVTYPGFCFRCILVVVVCLFAGTFHPTGIIAGAPANDNCEEIAGTWNTAYSGTSCEGEREEGTLVLIIKKDCSFSLERESIFAFLSPLLSYGKSLQLKDERIQATIGVLFDNCGEIMLEGEVKKTEKGLRITGTYRYYTQGGGHFGGDLETQKQ